MELDGPGMTFLHRAGLAGLWMTLESIERGPTARQVLEKAGGSWFRTSTSVTLRWEEDDGRFLKALLHESFKVDENGLIWFEGIGHPSKRLPSAAGLHHAVLGTFLQHAKSRSVESTTSSSLSIDVDGTPYAYHYRRLKSYKHQEVSLPVDGGLAALAGWQYPGGTVRHSGHGDRSTALEEPLGRFLPLLFAPVGAIYFIVRRIGEGVRPQYAIVIPDVKDLQTYVEVRRVFLTEWGILDIYVSGTEEAAFRVLASLQAHRMLEHLRSGSCHVISFGTVPWSSRQKTRVEVFNVRVGAEDWTVPYRASRTQPDLLPHLVQPKDQEPFIDVPQVPSLIAANLANRRSWWSGFGTFVADPKRWAHIIRYEGNGLAYMVEGSETIPDGAERVLVRACHEAWRNRLGMLGEEARSRGVPFSKLHNREFDRTRLVFAHCKDLNTFRETITGFWARSGTLDSLKERWGAILPFLGPRWQEGRDLALLALASYRGKSRDSAGSIEEGDKEEE